MEEHVLAFSEINFEKIASAGGKGGTLALTFQAGFPVPDGFVIFPSAFLEDELTYDAWGQIKIQLNRMRQDFPGLTFAVRSSALSEDSAAASFAGEFETILDLHSDQRIKSAIHEVRQSRHSDRVQAYSQFKGMTQNHDMAVVVQQMVKSEISGVLFTANPVSGSSSEMVGNYIYGFGDELVSGEVEPYNFTLECPKGIYKGPQDLKAYSRQLFKLGKKLEQDLGSPQDIEWTISERKLYLLQSRPITTLIGFNPETGEWNASLTGDYLWTNQMTGEVFADVMTPSSWSVWEILFNLLSAGDLASVGNIGGRPYVNFSVLYSFMLKFMRKHERVMKVLERTGGFASIPFGIEIPPVPIPTKTILLKVIPREMKNEVKKRKLLKNSAEFLAGVQVRCQQLRKRIRETVDKESLVTIWNDEIEPLLIETYTLQDATNERSVLQFAALKNEFIKLLGEDEANTFLSTMGGNWEQFASLGPLVDISKVARGEMSREEYVECYGHRGPYENELARPRPQENPNWVDEQITIFQESPTELGSLLEARRAEFDDVWQQFKENYPRKVKSTKQKMDEITEKSQLREATRSELTRILGIIRMFYLRAGELTDLKDGVFFLTYQELLDVISGHETSIAFIPARKRTLAKFTALPRYPSFIRGRFDPLLWAADPDRRSDVFDAQAEFPSSESDTIAGFAGSSGRVEGIVRRIDLLDEGVQLRAGEILVTVTTNIGWTPLFPRAAAVVTDVGAQLSHAAIVAREIGIPAVVGCGDATARLRTGDRVLVDGGKGIVKILEAESTGIDRLDMDAN